MLLSENGDRSPSDDQSVAIGFGTINQIRVRKGKFADSLTVVMSGQERHDPEHYQHSIGTHIAPVVAAGLGVVVAEAVCSRGQGGLRRRHFVNAGRFKHTMIPAHTSLWQSQLKVKAPVDTISIAT